mmetsp:Transcript_90978/g.262269  ORF Transcript_90978/g.262269 Transcript_90978/m.262269 type:complete len:200 (-) Transcript_90978:1327-1926(-)
MRLRWRHGFVAFGADRAEVNTRSLLLLIDVDMCPLLPIIAHGGVVICAALLRRLAMCHLVARRSHGRDENHKLHALFLLSGTLGRAGLLCRCARSLIVRRRGFRLERLRRLPRGGVLPSEPVRRTNLLCGVAVGLDPSAGRRRLALLLCVACGCVRAAPGGRSVGAPGVAVCLAAAASPTRGVLCHFALDLLRSLVYVC